MLKRKSLAMGLPSLPRKNGKQIRSDDERERRKKRGQQTKYKLFEVKNAWLS